MSGDSYMSAGFLTRQGVIMRLTYTLALLCSLQIKTSRARVESIELPPDLESYFYDYQSRTDLTQASGDTIFWNCMQKYITKFTKTTFSGATLSQINFMQENIRSMMQSLLSESNGKRKKRQSRGRRIRKELRMMTTLERNNYFRAVNELKMDTRVGPNVYDFLASFHSTRDNLRRAHFGPGFPGWHRVYLWIYENFLRQKVPTVTVPYWASVLDNDLPDARDTVIFSDTFFGNGVGEVNRGPFANWSQINPDNIITRNIGSGNLYTYEQIAAFMSKRNNAQILIPSSDPDSNFEIMHGGVHGWTGGVMNRLDSAPQDPVFYSHHAYVDKLWEDFRMQQRRNGINPQNDYPFIFNNASWPDEHRPDAPMGFAHPNITVRDVQQRVGYLNVFSALVRYEGIPTCTARRPDCGSIYLRCNSQFTPPRCMARTTAEVPQTNYVNDPKPPGHERPKQCTSPADINAFDDRTLGDNRSVSPSDWAIIPVQIITMRPPELKDFDGFSLYGYSPRTAFAHQSLKQQLIKRGNQYKTKSCTGKERAVGKTKIVSYGLNYMGTAHGNSVVDNRQGMYQGTGFVAVKKPNPGAVSEAIVAVFDCCGRVCRPFHKGYNSQTRSPFAGGVRVTNDQPLQYGGTYAEAIYDSWNIPDGNSCPNLNENKVPLTFFCDYESTWIWNSNTATVRQPTLPSSGIRRGGQSTSRRGGVTGPVLPTHLGGVDLSGSLSALGSLSGGALSPSHSISGFHGGAVPVISHSTGSLGSLGSSVHGSSRRTLGGAGAAKLRPSHSSTGFLGGTEHGASRSSLRGGSMHILPSDRARSTVDYGSSHGLLNPSRVGRRRRVGRGTEHLYLLGHNDSHRYARYPVMWF